MYLCIIKACLPKNGLESILVKRESDQEEGQVLTQSDMIPTNNFEKRQK